MSTNGVDEMARLAFASEVPANYFDVRVIGATTNCASDYTFSWCLDVIGTDDDFADRGITGYLTSHLTIYPDALPTDNDVDMYLRVTRLSTGRQDEYVFNARNVIAALDAQQIADCQLQTNACETCPCQIQNALPTTEPHN